MDNKPNLDFRYDECTNLVHAADGSHKAQGEALAQWLEKKLRLAAIADGRKSREDANAQAICPGCYTLILIEALLAMARNNSQSIEERCAYMAREFARLAEEAHNGRAVNPIEGDKL